MFFILAAIYFLLFLFLAWKNFRLAIILFIIFLPTYLIRFQVGPLPSTALELTFGALFLVWFVKYGRQDWKQIRAISKRHMWFFIALDLFFLASVASIFVSDMPIPSLGEWRAYFLEPMILFLILVGRTVIPTESAHADEWRNPLNSEVKGSLDFARDDRTQRIDFYDLILALALSTLSISVYAIIQKFTGWGIATPEWASEATRRVTAFFSSPNAVGLYLAPVAMLLLLIIWKKSKERGLIFWLLNIVCLLSLAAIFFTKSQGTWVGLAAGVLVFLFFVGYKKVALAMAVLGIIFSLVTPSMRQAVLFQDQANQNRLRLWGYSWEFLSRSPQNFILGAGVRQFFRKVQKPYYDKIVMERLIYPHNIFINFWTEIGLPGMLAAVTILGYIFYLANKIRKSDKLAGAVLLGALTVLVAHGLVDVPYFKNDLAFLFWIIISFVLIEYENIYFCKTDVIRGKSRKN
jgi:hypothetical protein